MAKKRVMQAAAPNVAPQLSVWPQRVEAFLVRYALLLFLAMVAIASARIISTYTVFNHTVDEPAHIACGMEWLDRGTYHYEAQHPPLSRVMMAILPHYIAKAHSWDRPLMFNEGAAVLYTGNDYDRTLALARIPVAHSSHECPPSRVTQTPPQETPTVTWRASRGSTQMEWMPG